MEFNSADHPLSLEPYDGLEKPRINLIVNPNATTTTPELRDLVALTLSTRFTVTVSETEAPKHAIELAKRAVADGFGVVACLGGDGTVNEVANGLALSDVILAPLPGGATNVFHRLLGVHPDPLDAAFQLIRKLDNWQPAKMDLGKIADRWFTFSGGVGLDAAAVKHVDAHPGLKARFGPWYFSLVGAKIFITKYLRNAPIITAEINGEPVASGVTAIFQNGPEFTYFSDKPVRMSRPSTFNSGHLTGVMLESTSPSVMPAITAHALHPERTLETLKSCTPFGEIKQLIIDSPSGELLPTQVDGDYFGDFANFEVSISPQALTVLL